MQTLPRTLAPAVCSAVLLLSACTGGGGSAPDDGGDSGTQVQGSGSEQAARELGDLGQREGIVDRTPATVVLNNVTAQGETLTVTFTVVNESDDGTIYIGSGFANDVDDSTGDANRSAEQNSVDGVYLTTEEGKRYLVGRGDNGICACSSGLSSATLDAGQSYTLSATFAAPPEAIETVTVHIPGYGAFEGVGIAR